MFWPAFCAAPSTPTFPLLCAEGPPQSCSFFPYTTLFRSTENRDDAASVVLAPLARLTSGAVTTGAWSIGALTWEFFNAPQYVPTLARTHRLSLPDPLWKLVCASCAAVTSMFWPALFATPP